MNNMQSKANAITKLARSSNNSDGSTLYVTASPCIECAKLIIQAGIKRVVYAEKYRLEDGINLLKRAKIEVEYLNPDDK
jgi:dCMP deaminase